MEQERLKQINELKNKIYKPRLSRIAKSTFCFFTDDHTGNPVPAGSGVLLKVNGNYFLVTAAHVLAEHLNSTYIIIGHDAIVIGGIAMSTPMPPSLSRDDDKIDLTVLKISDDIIGRILEWYIPIEEGRYKLITNWKMHQSIFFMVTSLQKQKGSLELTKLNPLGMHINLSQLLLLNMKNLDLHLIKILLLFMTVGLQVLQILENIYLLT